MNTFINNLFFIDNIKIIEDVKGLIKAAMFSCSCIKIMSPTVDQLSNHFVYNNLYKLVFNKMSYSAGNTKSKMVILYEPNIISYKIENSIWKLNLIENNLDLNNIYWNNLIDTRRINWTTLKEINPFYYFL
jgi:hypothetical protein